MSHVTQNDCEIIGTDVVYKLNVTPFMLTFLGWDKGDKPRLKRHGSLYRMILNNYG